MITLFRRIRQKLIDSGSVTKYLLYAVGEILLVVFGILIALQINNWNEYQKERVLERELLMQLRSEYESNLSQLDDKIDLRSMMIKAGTRLLEYVDNPEIRRADSTYLYIGQTTISPTFDPIVNDIISSGRIQLIRNAELRERLTRFTSDVIQVTEEEDGWLRARGAIYIPLLLENSSLRTIINRYWKDDLFSNFQLDRDIGVTPEIGDSETVTDINRLLENPKFEDAVANSLSYSFLINSQSYSLRNRINDILALIETELERG